MTVMIYGIRQCDTMKKAMKWLDEAGIAYEFHDYRKQGITREWLEERLDRLGWETMVNKRGTSYRQLDDAIKQQLSRDTVTAVLMDKPTLIKRPLLEHNDRSLLGFSANDYEQFFA